eukprot:6195551-Pleurochrysis_carterae.AAC.4
MSSLSSCPASDGTGLDTDATFEDTILGTREQVCHHGYVGLFYVSCRIGCAGHSNGLEGSVRTACLVAKVRREHDSGRLEDQAGAQEVLRAAVPLHLKSALTSNSRGSEWCIRLSAVSVGITLEAQLVRGVLILRNLERRRREASDAIVKKATQNVRNLFSVRFAVCLSSAYLGSERLHEPTECPKASSQCTAKRVYTCT